MSTVLLSHALYRPGMDILEKAGVKILIPNNGDSDVILPQLKQADAFILRIGKIDRKAMEACPNLKVITRPGVGVDNVDVKAATDFGVPVVICPASNFRSVAEHTIALIFACAKSIVRYDKETRKGNFSIRNEYAAEEILGKTLAILGSGHIGSEVAKLAQNLGMKVIIYDPFFTKEKAEAIGCSFAESVKDAVSVADFVTVHMPLLPTTKEMINKKIFCEMRNNAFFINCARGQIVNEQDMYEALRDHVIAGAAVDVLVKEPMDAFSPLMQLDNFIITPHSAAQTKEATGATVVMAAEGTLAVLRGEQYPNVCNPEVYNTVAWKKRQGKC